jgi:hypothetical protein
MGAARHTAATAPTKARSSARTASRLVHAVQLPTNSTSATGRSAPRAGGVPQEVLGLRAAGAAEREEVVGAARDACRSGAAPVLAEARIHEGAPLGGLEVREANPRARDGGPVDAALVVRDVDAARAIAREGGRAQREQRRGGGRRGAAQRGSSRRK